MQPYFNIRKRNRDKRLEFFLAFVSSFYPLMSYNAEPKNQVQGRSALTFFPIYEISEYQSAKDYAAGSNSAAVYMLSAVILLL